MNYKLIGAIVLGLVTTSITGATSTGVPFIFSAGSPARASEVNANFAALQAQIDNLTSGPSFQTVNVTRIDAAVGSQVTIAGQVFTICERIVPNLNSDAQYRVRFPSPLINSSRQCEISSSVAPWDSTISPGPRRAVIDGYIVALVASRFFNIVTLPVNQELSSFTQSISPVIFVEGGASISLPSVSLTQDLNGSSTLSPQQTRDAQLEQMKEILNYIKITRL